MQCIGQTKIAELSLVIPRLENVGKMPKLNPGINLGISFDLRIAITKLLGS